MKSYTPIKACKYLTYYRHTRTRARYTRAFISSENHKERWAEIELEEGEMVKKKVLISSFSFSPISLFTQPPHRFSPYPILSPSHRFSPFFLIIPLVSPLYLPRLSFPSLCPPFSRFPFSSLPLITSPFPFPLSYCPHFIFFPSLSLSLFSLFYLFFSFFSSSCLLFLLFSLLPYSSLNLVSPLPPSFSPLSSILPPFPFFISSPSHQLSLFPSYHSFPLLFPPFPSLTLPPHPRPTRDSVIAELVQRRHALTAG